MTLNCPLFCFPIFHEETILKLFLFPFYKHDSQEFYYLSLMTAAIKFLPRQRSYKMIDSAFDKKSISFLGDSSPFEANKISSRVAVMGGGISRLPEILEVSASDGDFQSVNIEFTLIELKVVKAKKNHQYQQQLYLHLEGAPAPAREL